MQRGSVRFEDAEVAVLGDAAPTERHTISGVLSATMRLSELALGAGGGSKRRLSPQASSSHSHSHSHSHSQSQSTLADRLTMMNIGTQELRGAVYYGWLWKKGSSFRTWKKRFFLLNGCTLTYYTQCCVISSDLLGGGTQCLDLPAKGGLRVRAAELSDQTEFGIRVTSSSGRVLFIQAGDVASRLQWVKALREAPRKKMMDTMVRKTLASDLMHSVGRRPGPDYGEHSFDETSVSIDSSDDGSEDLAGPGSPMLADRQGYLHIRKPIVHTWSRRYVVLSNGHLTVLRRRRPAAPQDKALEVISVHAYATRLDAFSVRLSNNRELLVRADSPAEAQTWIEALRISL